MVVGLRPKHEITFIIKMDTPSLGIRIAQLGLYNIARDLRECD